MRQKRTENIAMGCDLDNISLISSDDGASSAELMHQANLLLAGGATGSHNCSGATSEATTAGGAAHAPMTSPELNKPAMEPLFRDASTLPHQA